MVSMISCRIALAAHHVTVHIAVDDFQEQAVFGDVPEVLDEAHRLSERLVVGSVVQEFIRSQHLFVAGVAADLGPFFLD